MALVNVEGFRIGLNGFSLLQKNKPSCVTGNSLNKFASIFNHDSDSAMEATHVNRMIQRQSSKFLGVESAMPCDVG